MSDELSEFEPSSSSQWLALESNPEVLNEFAHRVGLSSHLEFVDYYGPGVLEQNPKAFLLLFPCSDKIYGFRQQQDLEIRSIPNYLEFSKHLCFVEQVEDFGNACGTIGCMHVLTNAQGAMDESSSSSLQGFRKSAKKSSPQERGRLLHQTDAFKSVSDSAAVSSEAQTSCPARDGADLDHHFVAFVLDEVTSHIFELDGEYKKTHC
jgi:ubiquitin carboxyl-terminal hydrolase L3